eukprot:Phypoly_transcript_04315.p1 GENE.Phypoly_transcript_04315~~Phypoly_transcript_04315.p1  ORF type:complete len:712 (-),score=56.46 Phypoly_transcript_04315:8-2143(-)
MLSHLSSEWKNIINQDLLVHRLQSIFPHEIPIVNSRKSSQLKYSDQHSLYLELDVWYPNLDLCFEFQDIYHYVTTWYFHEYPKKIQQRDSKKREKVLNSRLTLVVVPCWWDGLLESLKSTVHFQCPNLIQQSAHLPIPLNPPTNFFKANEIPDVGELMYAAFPIDPSIILSHKWWLGEKYDGIRFCWNPRQRSLYSRNSSEFSLIPSATTFMPLSALDGEFWFGRDSFEHTCAIVNDETSYIDWAQLRMIAFDNPSLNTQDFPFELRYKRLLDSTKPAHPFIIVASRFLVGRQSPFRYFIQLITENGGEGIILRKRESLYEHGRSLSLLKVKNSHGDKEGIVTGFVQNSPQLLLPNGTTLAVPPEDSATKQIKIGDIVTFSYERVSRSDAPANPKIIRVRRDVDWDDVVYHQTPSDEPSPDRVFLESVAKKRDMDPLLPSTWFNIGSTGVSTYQQGENIVEKFKGFSNAIRTLFPEIRFNFAKFTGSWRDMKARRTLLENFAKEHGFDPLNPENWNKRIMKKMALTKGMRSIAKHHNNSIAQTLLDLFPDIGLDKVKLKSSWTKRENRILFFEAYAKQRGFDPLNPENWRGISLANFKSQKRAGSILNHYGGSLARALRDLFPDIGLSRSSKNSWKDPNDRRKFFEDYATENGIDALNPDHWHSHSLLQIKQAKGARSMISHHNNRVTTALLDLFPDIGLDKSKFTKNSKM